MAITRLLILLLLTACAQQDAPGTAASPARSLNGEMGRATAAMLTNAAGRFGQIMEARYLSAGSRVLVLDKFFPQLRLFTSEGHELWTGGFPTDTAPPNRPQTISVHGDTVLVWQAGRVTVWELEHDSLAFRSALTLNEQLFPLGAARGCADEWVLYARDDGQFSSATAEHVDYLHAVRTSGGAVTVQPLWSDPRDHGAGLWLGHGAVTTSRYGSRLAVWHRSNVFLAGRLVEFDCHGVPIAQYDEQSFVTGDTLPALVPRRRALQWQSGLAALPDALLIAVHRYFSKVHGAEPPYWTTEFMWMRDGRFAGSTLVDRQWNLLDYDPQAERILISSYSPAYHFIHVPVSLLSQERGQ